MKTYYYETGFNISSSKFETTALENPYYETTSLGGTLIEQMKNNEIVVDEIKRSEINPVKITIS